MRIRRENVYVWCRAIKGSSCWILHAAAWGGGVSFSLPIHLDARLMSNDYVPSTRDGGESEDLAVKEITP